LSIISLEKRGAEDIEKYSRQIEGRIRSVTAVHEMLFRSKDLSAIVAGDFIGEPARLSSGMDAAKRLSASVSAERVILRGLRWRMSTDFGFVSCRLMIL
jgi:two-component sensor histidine kinase